MTLYAICYDKRAGEDYGPLILAIESTFVDGGWHHLDSTWIVKSDMSPGQICDALLPTIRPDGKILVAELTGGAHWLGFRGDAADWLSSQFVNPVGH